MSIGYRLTIDAEIREKEGMLEDEKTENLTRLLTYVMKKKRKNVPKVN
jgi:hypothetical protein